MIPYFVFNTETLKRYSALASLDEEQFGKVLDLLRSSSESFTTRGPIVEAASQLPGIDSQTFVQVVETVMPLLIHHLPAGSSANELVKGVGAAIRRNQDRKILTESREIRTALDRLSAVLTDPVIALKTRAINLVQLRSTILKTSRVITDFRPIFSGDRKATIQAASVIHTLVLECYENGRDISHHVALDSSDLQKLKEAIARAEMKEKALSDIGSSAGLVMVKVT